MQPIAPKVPENLDPLAREVLEGLRQQPAANQIILGGGVALQHYCEYRETRDLDAWWAEAPHASTEALLETTLSAIGERHSMTLKVRKSGDIQSYELQKAGRTRFGFQIAVRSVALERPMPSDWVPIQIESFLDNLGSKMNALVGRGAPRDFLDVREVTSRQLATESELWNAWRQKNPTGDLKEAQLAVLRYLELIETRRPIAAIADPQLREKARLLRQWTRESLCREALS
jgi:hypothetical protein